jgi:hypothetical protein
LKEQEHILRQLERLEAVEKRWLGSVLGSLILSGIMLAIALDHLHLNSILADVPAEIPAVQFLVMIVALTIILFVNLAAFIEYFTVEVHVQRQVVISKRHPRGQPDRDEE